MFGYLYDNTNKFFQKNTCIIKKENIDLYTVIKKVYTDTSIQPSTEFRTQHPIK